MRVLLSTYIEGTSVVHYLEVKGKAVLPHGSLILSLQKKILFYFLYT